LNGFSRRAGDWRYRAISGRWPGQLRGRAAQNNKSKEETPVGVWRKARTRTMVQVSAAALAACLSSGLAHANELVDATDPEKLVSVIRDLGYRAKLERDNVGDPLIKSSVGGTQFWIAFYGCNKVTNDGCGLLLYKVGFDLDEATELDVINRWNESQLIGRAYRDEVGDPWLEMAVNLEGGVTRANFEKTFELWDGALARFESHIRL
jgi:hypothetical protein